MRFINVAFFILLLIILTISSSVYCYQKSPTFRNIIENYLTFCKTFISPMANFHYKNHLDYKLGIMVVLFIMVVVLIKAFVNKSVTTLRFNSTLIFFLILASVLLIGICSFIYYSDEDTILIGNIWKLQRHTQHNFRQNVNHFCTLLLIAALYYLITVRLYLGIRIAIRGEEFTEAAQVHYQIRMAQYNIATNKKPIVHLDNLKRQEKVIEDPNKLVAMKAVKSVPRKPNPITGKSSSQTQAKQPAAKPNSPQKKHQGKYAQDFGLIPGTETIKKQSKYKKKPN